MRGLSLWIDAALTMGMNYFLRVISVFLPFPHCLWHQSLLPWYGAIAILRMGFSKWDVLSRRLSKNGSGTENQ